MDNIVYLLLDFFSILFPLLLSFNSKSEYFFYFKKLLPSVLIVGALFIIHDIYFTKIVKYFLIKSTLMLAIINCTISRFRSCSQCRSDCRHMRIHHYYRLHQRCKCRVQSSFDQCKDLSLCN